MDQGLHIYLAGDRILHQLERVVGELRDDDFSRPVAALSGSSIGQHLRHTLEFFICLREGMPSGVVNYDERARDTQLESSRSLALEAIGTLRSFLSENRNDMPMHLSVGYHQDREEQICIESNFHRELIYNIEHAVHHMAIMKIGIREVAPEIALPSDFGVAVSTIRHRNQLTHSVKV